MIASFLFTTVILNGCLLFNTVSYKVNLNDVKTGSVEVTINNIKSDAVNSSELNEDRKNLFDFALKSDDFVNQMKDEGKFITHRELYIEDDKLNGKINYSFDDITNVEGIVYEEPFYYLTLGLEDSIVSTNGEVIVSEQHKRVLWDNSIKTLQFTMFSENTDNKLLTDLKKYLEHN